VTSHRPRGGYEGFTEKLSELVHQLETASQNSDVPVVDFYRPFLQQNGTVDTGLFLEDGLHPNLAGHLLMAEKTAVLFREAFRF